VKRMRVTVNGTVYDVVVEVLEDSDEPGYGYQSTHHPPSPPATSRPAAKASVASPVAAPAAPKQNELASPIAGMVTEIKVAVGDTVKENQLLMNIEAMKMNTHICSPVAGRIASIKVSEKDGVKQGQVLLTFA